MIAHVVLFKPRADVSSDDRRALVDAWARALSGIPSIRRARVGRRVRIGRAYEQLARVDLPYAAVLEFDDVDGLRAYLDHPAHEALTTKFFAALADTLIYDFDVDESADGLRGLDDPAAG